MTQRYDVVVIGAGLGGLTAAALLARAGRKVLVLERNNSVGGAASTYKSRDLVIEGGLHMTADPRDPTEPKHHVLARLGLLDAVEWVPAGALYEVRGGPIGAPFVLPHGFAAARAALDARFPAARGGTAQVLGDMERIAAGLGTLSRRRAAFRNPREGFGALLKLAPMVRDWRRSLAAVFARAFGADEAVKCALAANLGYYHADPARLWWVFFAAAQGGFLGCGGTFVRGDSQRLSSALARAVKAAGGEVLIRRAATEIRPGTDGAPATVVHTHRDGSDRVAVEARVVAGNAAPAALARMLPQPAGARLEAAYAGRRLSLSLFSITLGLSAPAASFGVRAYTSVLLPPWLTRLADYPRSAAVLGAAPGGDAPLMTLVDYAAIESGLGGPPYPVVVAGLDRLENWAGLDAAAYDAKRRQWLDAILGALDAQFPGLAGAVVANSFNTASSVHNYLGTPQGAIYGFAPEPPAGPIWNGVGRSPATPIPGLYLASAYAGFGGFTGALLAGEAAAERILAAGG